jgi:hypothetical protein
VLPDILDLSFEPAYFVPFFTDSQSERENVLNTLLAQKDHIPSRNGVYKCTQIEMQDGSPAAFIRWAARQERTPALELKAALRTKIEAAFRKPPLKELARPDLEGTIRRSIEPGDLEGSEQPILSDFLPQPNQTDRDLFAKLGFEAVAWYQPFHIYDESTWGIYFDSVKLDAFAAMLAYDLNSERRSSVLAAKLAFGMIRSHELFHAKLEFAATFLELAARSARYLRYQHDVYNPTYLTSNCKEEALANWTSFSWVREEIQDLKRRQIIENSSHVLRVAENWLDFSPPGYRDWRLGNTHHCWDQISSELSEGELFSELSNPVLPLGGLIRLDGTFDLAPEDVPMYFVGEGLLSTLFFGAPARREILRVLKHFGYHPIAGRGKGSHEVWAGKSGNTFTLPIRDPLSVGVFHSLLNHFGWSKEEYMQLIRSQI